MNSDEDIYLVHLEKEINLINYAKNNSNVVIIREDSCMLTPNYVSKTYHIEYNNFALFRFNLTTTREPMRTVIAKQKIIIQEINTDESIKKFIDKCEKFAVKLIGDYQVIKRIYYIKDWTNYFDKLYLKNVSGRTDFDYVEIEITIEGFYLLIISNVLIESYGNIDDLIQSKYILPLKRTFFKNILNFVGLL